MLKIIIIFMTAFFMQLHAQTQIGKLSVKLSEHWKVTKTDNKLLQIDYQKASARAQIHFLGNMDSDKASQYMVDMFKTQNVDPVKFQKAVQAKSKIGKTEALKFSWVDEMYLDSQKKTMVTGYQLYLLEFKEEKYYIFTTDYYIKEEQVPHTNEFDNFFSQFMLK